MPLQTLQWQHKETAARTEALSERETKCDLHFYKIARVCRSSYAAETLGVEEALDSGELCRAFLAEIRGAPLLQDHRSVYMVPLVAVTDAKDVHDRCSNDLGFGAQKSLVLTLASLRQQLREPDTNEMDPLRKPLCRWRNQRDGLRGSAHRPHAGDLEH